MSIRPTVALPIAATALMLAACGQQEERTFEADAQDESGSELIVTEETPEAVDVDMPEAPMTNAPEETEPTPE